jgi:tagatose-1,6-bisphosphate aldolase
VTDDPPFCTSLRVMTFNRAFAVAFVFLSALVNAATYTGKIQVINGEGSSNGFLKNWSSGL